MNPQSPTPSKTPRTDAAEAFDKSIIGQINLGYFKTRQVARQLETELAEVTKLVEELAEALILSHRGAMKLATHERLTLEECAICDVKTSKSLFAYEQFKQRKDSK